MYTSNGPTIQMLQSHGITQSNKGMFKSITTDEYGNNETVIELSDLHPSVLWNIKNGEENEIKIKAEEGYKIVVLIMECSIKSNHSFVKISSSKCTLTRIVLKTVL